MTESKEFRFLCRVLKKSRLDVGSLPPKAPAISLFDKRLAEATGLSLREGVTVEDYLGKIEPVTKYEFTDGFHLKHICFLLPWEKDGALFHIGPYLSAPLAKDEMLAMGEQLGLSPAQQKYYEEYLEALPTLSESDGIHTVIDTFCEEIWQKPSFAVVRAGNATPPNTASILPPRDRLDEVLTDVDRMAARYAFENEIIQAVKLGQQHKVSLFSINLENEIFEKRNPDSLRNAKNYCIIMNTLLRKAAEEGGVHPLYIDRQSSVIAEKIEKVPSLKEIPALMKEIFSAYARLVYQHAVKKFSPIVQKTVLAIDSDLSADLSLNTLANHLGISRGYLATVFKKEQGRTVTEYVLEKRMKHAAHLLRTTNLQIQSVASLCGILDVQYFSKLFKKHHGKTPREYRLAAKHSQ